MAKNIIIVVSIAVLVILGLWAYNYHQKTLIQARQEAITDLMNKDKVLQAKNDSAQAKAVIMGKTIDSLIVIGNRIQHDTIILRQQYVQQSNALFALSDDEQISKLANNLSQKGSIK